MDHYVVDFDYNMLYFDLLELIELIKEHGSENLKDYVESLENIAKKATE